MQDRSPARRLKKLLPERLLDAETRGSRWLADGNAASEAGDSFGAELCYQRAQYWLDRANLLSGRSDKPIPKR